MPVWHRKCPATVSALLAERKLISIVVENTAGGGVRVEHQIEHYY